MNGKFTKIAAIAFATCLGAGGAALVPAARGDDIRAGGVYVPTPSYPGGRDARGLREPVSRLCRDVDHMYDVVRSYGGDNYARLRDDVYELRGSADRLEDAIDRGDSGGIGGAYSGVSRAMDDTDFRMHNVQFVTPAIGDAWQRVNESFRDVQERMR